MTPREIAAIRRLAERVARLNPHSREIGAGMLATLQAEAATVLEVLKGK